MSITRYSSVIRQKENIDYSTMTNCKYQSSIQLLLSFYIPSFNSGIFIVVIFYTFWFNISICLNGHVGLILLLLTGFSILVVAVV